MLYDKLISEPFGLPTHAEEKRRASSTEEGLSESTEETSGLSDAFSGSSILMGAILVFVAIALLVALIALVILCRKLIVARCCKPVVKIVQVIE